MIVSASTQETTADIAALVQRHQVGLWRYLRVLGCEPELAEDIVQDSFLAAFRSPPGIPEADSTGWNRWLKTVARNRFISHRRRSKRQVDFGLIGDVDALFASSAEDGGDAAMVALESCVKRLDGRSLAVIRARFGDELTAAETAERIGIGESNVGVILHRAIRRLRECMEGRLSDGRA